MTIYLGPTLVLIGWWWVLRKLVRIGRSQRVTSIADLISSRYGKSNVLGVIVTLISVVGGDALYRAATAIGDAVLRGLCRRAHRRAGPSPIRRATALWVAAGLTLFTILFGTRNLDANERHHGVVMAIALEAVVKLVALLAVGIFVVWGMAGGVVAMHGADRCLAHRRLAAGPRPLDRR